MARTRHRGAKTMALMAPDSSRPDHPTHGHLWYRRDEETDVSELCDATRPHEKITNTPRRATEELAAQALATGQHSGTTRPILEKMAAGARDDG